MDAALDNLGVFRMYQETMLRLAGPDSIALARINVPTTPVSAHHTLNSLPSTSSPGPGSVVSLAGASATSGSGGQDSQGDRNRASSGFSSPYEASVAGSSPGGGAVGLAGSRHSSFSGSIDGTHLGNNGPTTPSQAYYSRVLSEVLQDHALFSVHRGIIGAVGW